MFRVILSDAYRDGNEYRTDIEIVDAETFETIDSFVALTMPNADYETRYNECVDVLESNGYGVWESAGNIYVEVLS